VFSVRTGQHIDTLEGHTAPIRSLSFSALGTVLVSGSWDETAKIWDVFDKKANVQTMQHGSEVVSVAFANGGRQVLVATLGGAVHQWDVEDDQLLAVLDCKDDIKGGRFKADRNTAKTSTKNKHFNSIAVSPNGAFLIGGGNSNKLCLYDIRHKILLRRFIITHNRSVDGVLDKLNNKAVNEFGADHEFDIESEEEQLKGAKRDEQVKRKLTLAVRVKKIIFSPDGGSFACATSEGLVIYSL